MLRKLSLAAVAVVALGAALAPTSASAHWHGGWGHGGGGGWHHGWGGPRFYAGGPVSYGYGGCYVRPLVPAPRGPPPRVINRRFLAPHHPSQATSTPTNPPSENPASPPARGLY